jgi:DNA-binding helix-hairpin-helix protein with protein kinase domain
MSTETEDLIAEANEVLDSGPINYAWVARLIGVAKRLVSALSSSLQEVEQLRAEIQKRAEIENRVRAERDAAVAAIAQALDLIGDIGPEARRILTAARPALPEGERTDG